MTGSGPRQSKLTEFCPVMVQWISSAPNASEALISPRTARTPIATCRTKPPCMTTSGVARPRVFHGQDAGEGVDEYEYRQPILMPPEQVPRVRAVYRRMPVPTQAAVSQDGLAPVS